MAEATDGVGAELRQSAPVQKWFSGLEKHYGASSREEEERRIDSLRRFCAFIESTPEEIIKRSFYRKKDGGDLRISIKSRNFMSEKIAEFQDSVEGSVFDKAREGNAVRSFLIHNGVLMQSGVQH
ncbi:MAG: hypothetical protein WEB00_01225 [Dehalococcoidia bacterium]